MCTVFRNYHAARKRIRLTRLSILLQVEAEEVPDVTDRYGVTVVPYFLIVKVLPNLHCSSSLAYGCTLLTMQAVEKASVACCGTRQEPCVLTF